MDSKLTIIIVNYYSGVVLKDCLRSIELQSSQLVETIVVNNSPDDNDMTSIKLLFPKVKVIETGYNAGFSRANNMGIDTAESMYVLLLNSDTILPQGIVMDYLNWMDTHANFVAIGTSLIYPDGTTQISGNYNMPGGVNYLLQIPFFGSLLKAVGTIASVRKPNVKAISGEVEEVDWINGAFLWVRADTVKKAGKLDADFFLYHEESEWCSRLKKYGKLGILGLHKVVHIEGYSSGKTFDSNTSSHNNLFDKKGKQLFLSMLVRIRKEFGIGWLLFHLFAFTISCPFVLLIGTVESLFISPTTNTSKPYKYIDYVKNILNGWKYFPQLVKNTPYFYNTI